MFTSANDEGVTVLMAAADGGSADTFVGALAALKNLLYKEEAQEVRVKASWPSSYFFFFAPFSLSPEHVFHVRIYLVTAGIGRFCGNSETCGGCSTDAWRYSGADRDGVLV